jgi:hypothetical protein
MPYIEVNVSIADGHVAKTLNDGAIFWNRRLMQFFQLHSGPGSGKWYLRPTPFHVRATTTTHPTALDAVAHAMVHDGLIRVHVGDRVVLDVVDGIEK